MSSNARPLAERLLAAGIPVVVVQPCPAPGACKRGRDGHTEHYPSGWETITADQCDLSRYRPGTDALALVGGHGIDLVDEDTKADGSIDNLPPFKDFGVTRTPSGGRHFVVPSNGLGKITPLTTENGHVGDYVGGRDDGSGRMLGFLPGTVRGKPEHGGRPYVEEVAWDIEGCLAARANVDLMLMLTGCGGSREPRDRYVDESPERDPALGLHPYAEAAIRAELQRLDDLPHPWSEGSHWDATTFEVACNLVEFANSGWTGYGLQRAFEDLLDHAPADEAWGEHQHQAKWASALATVEDGGRREPEQLTAGDDFSVVPGPAPASPTSNAPVPPLAVRLRERVESVYDVFPAGNDGRIFVQPKVGGRAELLTSGFVIRAGRGAGSQSSTLSAAATEAAKVLAALAEVKPARALALRVHHTPDRIVLDLAQPGTSRCVVVTPAGWAVEDVPPADVVFQSAGRPLPDPERGGDLDELRRVLRWAEADPRWPLVKGWLPCALLADVPRPLLAFFGPQGSAKSTTGRFVVDLIDPKPGGALGSGFGKNRSDDETKAFASYLVAWDNVSKVSDEGADLLSRLVTGDMIERRRLYTDSDIATIMYRRTGVLTGISVPRGIKADTLDRLLLVSLSPLAERVSERALEAEWAQARPRVMAGVLDHAVLMLAGERRNPDRLRMADYAEALWAIDPALYRAYADNVSEAREEMAGNDPFIVTLRDWLAAEPGQTWEGSATDARRAAEWRRVEEMTWWPANGKSFMDTVTGNLELLREVGITVTERKSNGSKLKRFALSNLPREDRDLL